MKLDLSICLWSLRWKQIGAGVARIRDAVFCFEGRFSARLVEKRLIPELAVYLGSFLAGICTLIL